LFRVGTCEISDSIIKELNGNAFPGKQLKFFFDLSILKYYSTFQDHSDKHRNLIVKLADSSTVLNTYNNSVYIERMPNVI